MTTPAAPTGPKGYRIRHVDPRFRGALLKVPDPDRRILVRGRPAVLHPDTGEVLVPARPDELVPKTYHVRLDGEGCAIVSEVVWEQLQRCTHHMAGSGVELPQLAFVLENVVEGPPTQIIGGGTVERPAFTVDADGIHPEGPAAEAAIRLKDR